MNNKIESNLLEFDQKPQARKEGDAQEPQQSGEIAKLSGLYRLDHRNHEILLELVLIENTPLPYCASCDAPIFFHLIQHAPLISNDPDFQ